MKKLYDVSPALIIALLILCSISIGMAIQRIIDNNYLMELIESQSR